MQGLKKDVRDLDPQEIVRIAEDRRCFSLIKRDDRATSGIIRGDACGLPRDLWVKWFHDRGWRDFLVRLFAGDRAKRLWKAHLLFHGAGLPVPRPIAFHGSSFSRRDAFFLANSLEGAVNLGEAFRSGTLKDLKGIARRLGDDIARWHLSGAVHGDLKWSNILLSGSGEYLRIYFIDLDQARLYRRPRISGMMKDLSRFYRYGLEMGAEDWVASRVLPAYLEALPGALRARLCLSSIRQRACRDWEKRGKRRLDR